MKIFAFLVTVLMSMVLYTTANACEITFEPKTVKVGADGKGTFTGIIKWEHRKCPLADDDVNIDEKGAKVLEQSGWKKVKRGLYKNEFKVQLTADKGTLRVWRECDKKGISEGTLEVKK